MVRNIVVFGGSSHPQLLENICNHLGIPPGSVILGKFSVGETRVEIKESVRGKDVYIIQSGSGGKVNDNLMELLIAISACKTASANKVTAVLPMFPYSRQSDLPYRRLGAPLSRPATNMSLSSSQQSSEQNAQKSVSRVETENHLEQNHSSGDRSDLARSTETIQFNPKSSNSERGPAANVHELPHINGNQNKTAQAAQTPAFEPQRGYKQWVAQAGTLVADLLTCAGTDHVITMDLHDPQYQGFFDIPVDNLYGRHLLRKYIKESIPNYQHAVIVSPDAGGAKRATAIADGLGMPFALIHKERRAMQTNDRHNPSMLLVGNVEGRTAILIDDLADTSNTITQAAKLLKREGAAQIYGLITHGVLSGDAIDRINASFLDKVVVTNTVDQKEHQSRCPKLEVLDVSMIFAEAIRRVHHGESISVLFEHD